MKDLKVPVLLKFIPPETQLKRCEFPLFVFLWILLITSRCITFYDLSYVPCIFGGGISCFCWKLEASKRTTKSVWSIMFDLIKIMVWMGGGTVGRGCLPRWPKTQEISPQTSTRTPGSPESGFASRNQPSVNSAAAWRGCLLATV